MVHSRALRSPWILPIVVLALSGCQRDVYRHETVLHSDGRVTRTIFQSSEEIRSPGEWAETGRAPQDYDGDLDAVFGPEDQRPSVSENDPGHERNVARGTFASSEQIPAHFVRKPLTGTGESRLERQYERSDFGLFIEHRWIETVTDSVNLSDSQRATQELAELHVGLWTDALNRTYGDEHDFTRLHAWLMDDGVAWLVELSGAYLQVATFKLPSNQLEARLHGEIARITQRYGLDLSGADGMLVEREEYNRRGEEFVANKLRDLIDRHDRRRVDDQVIGEILRAKDDPSLPLHVAWEQLVAERFGDSDELVRQNRQYLDRICGVYGWPLGTTVSFEFAMQVPGIIVETNGTLLTDDRLRWEFDGEQVFPFGYAMTCRSIEPQVELQRLLWNGKTITEREGMLDALKLLEDETLRAALVECARENSVAPIDRLRAATDMEEHADALVRLSRLERLAR